MKNLSLVFCGVSDCQMLASNGVIIGTQNFCLVPTQNNVPDPLPLLRYNLCTQHLDDVRFNFKEVHHNENSKDFSDISAFI